MKTLLLAVLCSWMAIFPTFATAQDRVGAMPETLLIRNVTLIDQKGETEDTIVTILIRDNKLDLITQDEIPVDTVELAMDAQKWILLGKLKMGEAPSFVILDGDPREDFQVLLDTATYARFAIKDGVIERNWLLKALDIDEKPRRSGWLVYNPSAPGLAILLQGHQQMEPLGHAVHLRDIHRCRRAGSSELADPGQEQ